MADRLDELEQEIVIPLLRSWVDVYRRGQRVYDAYPEETRALVDEQGHDVDSLVFVVAQMKPHVRDVCRALVEDALTAALSQPLGSVEDAAEEVAQAKSGTESMNGEEAEDRVAQLEAENETLRAVLRSVAALAGTAAGADGSGQGFAEDLRQRRIAD